MLVKNLGVNALLPMLCRLRFSKSFQSNNHVYCELNNSTLNFLSGFLEKSFLTLKLCWSFQYNSFMMSYIKLIIKLDKNRQNTPILIATDTVEHT